MLIEAEDLADEGIAEGTHLHATYIHIPGVFSHLLTISNVHACGRATSICTKKIKLDTLYRSTQ